MGSVDAPPLDATVNVPVPLAVYAIGVAGVEVKPVIAWAILLITMDLVIWLAIP